MPASDQFAAALAGGLAGGAIVYCMLKSQATPEAVADQVVGYAAPAPRSKPAAAGQGDDLAFVPEVR